MNSTPKPMVMPAIQADRNTDVTLGRVAHQHVQASLPALWACRAILGGSGYAFDPPPKSQSLGPKLLAAGGATVHLYPRSEPSDIDTDADNDNAHYDEDLK